MYNKEIELILGYAKGKVDDIEVLIEKSSTNSVSVINGELENNQFSNKLGLGVRTILRGKTGYSYTEDFAERSLLKAVDYAIENAWVVESDDVAFLTNFPEEPFEYNGFKQELESITSEDMLHYALLMEKTAREDPLVRVVNGCRVLKGSGFTQIANSKGLNRNQKENTVFAVIGVLVGKGDDVKQGYKGKIMHDLNECKVKKLARKAVEYAKSLLDAQDFESGAYPVVIESGTMGSFLSTFSSAFSAKSVHDGNSLFKDKLNTQIASTKVSIIDDGKLPCGVATSPFDAEGFPSQTTILIQDGRLTNLLHNSLTAEKDNTRSTGNASRNYLTPLDVAPTNLFVKPGNGSKDEMFKKYPEVIEIVSLSGLHSGANTISGDFSLSAGGFLWKDGKRMHSLKNFTVSGNFYQVLQDIEEVSDDLEFFMSSIGSPSVLVSKLALSN